MLTWAVRHSSSTNTRAHPRLALAEFNAYDNGVAHKAFLFGGPRPARRVTGGEQFLESVNRVARLRIEAHVMVHSWLASYPIEWRHIRACHQLHAPASPASRIRSSTRRHGGSGWRPSEKGCKELEDERGQSGGEIVSEKEVAARVSDWRNRHIQL